MTVAAALLRIPSATMFDYEWATVQHNVNCRLARAVVVPDAIPPQRLERYGARGKMRPYEGLKEEYYLADFEPDDGVLAELGLDPCPADRGRAHATRGLALPPLRERRLRGRAATPARRRGGAGAAAGGAAARRRAARGAVAGVPGFVVPEHAIDAQSLIAYADLVISAGGTMNREAVALGTPVYTTFQGRLGAVDERLLEEGRLRMLRDAAELDLARRTTAGVAPRVRRDPRVLVELLLSPIRA